LPYDPFHQCEIKFSIDETKIANLPEMLRLKYVKQLGFTHLQFPAANHVRYDHSIGVVIACKSLCERLMHEGIMTTDDIEVMRISALIHDIGHGAYSHLAERLWGILWGSRTLTTRPKYDSHETIGKALIMGKLQLDLESHCLKETKKDRGRVREGLDSTSVAASEIAKVLSGRRSFMSQAISGDLDIDRIDYLLRDCFFTGAAHGFNTLSCLNMLISGFTVHGNKLLLDEEYLHHAIHLLHARDTLYPSVYMHPVPRSANAMLIRAFEIEFEGKTVDEVYKVIFGNTDDQLLCRIESSQNSRVAEIATALRYGPLYQPLLEDGITWKTLHKDVRNEIEGACLAKRQLKGNILANLRIIEKVAEDRLCTEASIPPDQKHLIAVDIPEVPRLHELKAKVLVRRGRKKTAQPIEKMSKAARALSLEHRNYWSINVYASPRVSKYSSKLVDTMDHLFVKGQILQFL